MVDVMDVVLTYTRFEGAARTAVSRMTTHTEAAAKITWEGTSRARTVMCARELSKILKANRGVVARRTADIILQISENSEQKQIQPYAKPVNTIESISMDKSFLNDRIHAHVPEICPVPVTTESDKTSSDTSVQVPRPTLKMTISDQITRENIMWQQIMWQNARYQRAIVPVDPGVAQRKRKMADIEIDKHEIELEKQRKLSELEVKRAKDDAEVGLVKTKFLMLVSIGQEERANRLLDTLLD